MNQKLAQPLFIFFGLCVLIVPFSSAAALLLGLACALTMGNPYLAQTKKLTPLFLGIAITGLGASMNLNTVAQAGGQGIIYTFLGIILTMALGLALGKWLGVTREASLLISSGTAICGGSAIAAVAATINSKNENTSVALITVFMLNALALLIFPIIGHLLNLDQTQFGLWSALAIHDTSSVVGAAVQYGQRALEIATPVKLARALWIVPLCLAIKNFLLEKNHKGATKAKIPWFIPGFLIAAALVTWVPMLTGPGFIIATLAKRVLVVTLFFIGAGLTRPALKNVGMWPFMQGVLLWVAVAAGSLIAIRTGIITWKI